MFNPETISGIFLLVIVILALAKKHGILSSLIKPWYVIAGTSGILILLLWFATDHQATKINWNIIWLNPLYFLLLFKKFPYKKELLFILILLTILCLVNSITPFIPQVMPVSYFLPFVLAMAFVADKMRVGQRTKSEERSA